MKAQSQSERQEEMLLLRKRNLCVNLFSQEQEEMFLRTIPLFATKKRGERGKGKERRRKRKRIVRFQMKLKRFLKNGPPRKLWNFWVVRWEDQISFRTSMGGQEMVLLLRKRNPCLLLLSQEQGEVLLKTMPTFARCAKYLFKGFWGILPVQPTVHKSTTCKNCTQKIRQKVMQKEKRRESKEQKGGWESRRRACF